MTQALYAHMNNKRKKKREQQGEQLEIKGAVQATCS
jgi:hypothetical protein